MPLSVAPRINTPKRLRELPAWIDLGFGMRFVFEGDRYGNVIGGAWVHPNGATGVPCANACYFNLDAAAGSYVTKDRPLYDVFSWSPLTIAYYWSCQAFLCNLHGKIIGSRFVPS